MIHIIPLIAYTIIIWLFGSFVAWDIAWFLYIGEWSAFERGCLFIGVSISILPFIVIPCVVVDERSSKNENQR